MKYTIIIPIYNAAKKIGRALESVQKQSVKDLEIICVNDGSTDHSAELVKNYAEKDKRIKLYSQENKGPGASRNFALDLAQGEYIAFLDADDAYDDEKALEKMYNVACANNAELCMAKIYYVIGGERKVVVKVKDTVSRKTKFRFVDFQCDFYFTAYIYKRDFLNENKIRFPQRRVYEDPIFLIGVLTKTEYIYCVDIDFYLYYWEKTVRETSLETVDELLGGFLEVMEIAAERNYYRLKDEILNRLDNNCYKDVCQYANRPCVLKKLIQLNDYDNKERFEIRVLRYLLEFGWSQDLYLTKKLDKLRGLSLKDKQVVIYGAGGAGIDCFNLNKRYSEFRLRAWVDVNKAGEEIDGTVIKNIECLLELEFDKIIVAIRDDQLYEEIVVNLMKMGIEVNKILRWK